MRRDLSSGTRYPRRSEGVFSDLGFDAGILRPTPNHRVCVRLAHRPTRERIGFSYASAKQLSFGIRFQTGALDVGFQVFVEIVIRRHVRGWVRLHEKSDKRRRTTKSYDVQCTTCRL
jgi:hypothetical protein